MKSFQIKTRVNFGDNALDRLAEVPYKKILIVTDPFMAKSKNLNLILDPIKKAGKEYDIFQDIVPDPPIEKISLGVKKMLEYKPDAIVAVGGGSAIDSSKSIREFALRVDHYAEVGLIFAEFFNSFASSLPLRYETRLQRDVRTIRGVSIGRRPSRAARCEGGAYG